MTSTVKPHRWIATCYAFAHCALATLLLATLGAFAQAAEQIALTDKTLVVWAAPANLTQQAGSALTIDDGQSHFDGIVFGEITDRKWMPGSDYTRRTLKEQADWPAETADGKTFVQLAIVYRGREVSVFRDGRDYATYTMPNPPQTFGPAAIALFGRRHLDATDLNHSFGLVVVR